MVNVGSTFVVVLTFLPLFSSVLVGTSAAGTNTGTCISLSTDVVSDPVSREISKVASALKIITALQNGIIDVAQKYWSEIVCLESQRTDVDQSTLGQRLVPSVHRIIRDFLSISEFGGGPNRGRRLKTSLLRFIDQFENVPKESALEFLLNEMGDLNTGLYYLSHFIFDLGAMIKESQGSDSQLFKKLPKVVQQIVSGQQVVLKNQKTNRFLNIDTLETTSAALNKVNGRTTDAGTDRSQLKWTFEPVKNLNQDPSWNQPNIYLFRVKSTNPGSSQLLKANLIDGPQTPPDSYYSDRVTTTTIPPTIKVHTEFTLDLGPPDTISIRVGSVYRHSYQFQFLTQDESNKVVVEWNRDADEQSNETFNRLWVVEV